MIYILSFSNLATAYETDQYTNRHQPIRDCTEVLNAKVNDTLREIANHWRGGENEWRFVMAVYWKIGGLHWVDKLERWAMTSPDVDRLSTPRKKSIYHDLPICATRVAHFFGVGDTIKVNNQLIGTDKIGHFLSQGRKFYKRYRRSGSEERAARRSSATERGIFGQKTTGSYSNADLVANYEGYRFYRSLFHDDIIPGKPAILRWENGKPILQREFDWADHVNEFWDEALNPNHFDKLLYRHMKKKLLGFCEQYRKNPQLYQIENEEALKRRYAHLRLRDTSELRLDRLCASIDSGP